MDTAREERNVLFHEPKNFMKSTPCHTPHKDTSIQVYTFLRLCRIFHVTAHKMPPVSHLGNASDDIKMV
jgi:hypothetical protein